MGIVLLLGRPSWKVRRPGVSSPDNGGGAEADPGRRALVRDLDLVARGDERAMARVYASTAPQLNALLTHMLRNPAEAEEVLQEVYLAVWRRSASYDASRASPMTWLVAIARNRAIDRMRANEAAHRALSSYQLGAIEPPNPALTAREEADDTRRLVMCLEALDARAKTAIRAAFFEGLTYHQLASRDGMPLGTMKSLIRRGLIRLRKCMTDESDE